MTNKIILHHYDASPFTEAVRLALGVKGRGMVLGDPAQCSAQTRSHPANGRVQKIPVMQIGADVYCDSALILQEIDRRIPSPSLYAGLDPQVVSALGAWIESSVFPQAVTLLFGGTSPILTDSFISDREKFSGRAINFAAAKKASPLALQQLQAALLPLSALLSDGRPFLLGDTPSLFDVKAFHGIWFARAVSDKELSAIDAIAGLTDWEARVAAIGHGVRSELSPDDALAIARAAEPDAPRATSQAIDGLSLGDPVVARSTTTGPEPVEGELCGWSHDQLSIRRNTPELGEIIVHVPRTGFTLKKAAR